MLDNAAMFFVIRIEIQSHVFDFNRCFNEFWKVSFPYSKHFYTTTNELHV